MYPNKPTASNGISAATPFTLLTAPSSSTILATSAQNVASQLTQIRHPNRESTSTSTSRQPKVVNSVTTPNLPVMNSIHSTWSMPHQYIDLTQPSGRQASPRAVAAADFLEQTRQRAINALVQAQMREVQKNAAQNLTGQAAKVTTAPKQQVEQIPDEMQKIVDEQVEGNLSEEVFFNYQYREILPGCQPHPGQIVEAGSLASVPLPVASYPLGDTVPESALISGQLSSLQLESVMYACQRHQILLPNSTRAGFFIGDGAGVGKGRQIAALILDNFCRGRKRHIWFSTSSDLIMDAKRDLTDIGCHIRVIEGCKQLDRETKVLGLPLDFKEGVIFSTYATLISSTSRHGRLQQLVNWCGGDQFSGCLIFDECHKAKNFVPGKESASTKVALAVNDIQKILPKARVVYCSATGVTDVKNMAFMERLGLWGEGAPFRSFDSFYDTIQKRGLGVAELLSMEMKAAGIYVSRGLSFKEAEFAPLDVVLTREQIHMYDQSAVFWNELRQLLEMALSKTSTASARIWANYWSCHQRFFKQMCMGIKLPCVMAEAKRALDNGLSVVIGLQTTGEASMECERLHNGLRIKNFVSLCREILVRFIELHFPTLVTCPQLAAPGPPVPDLVHDPWCLGAKQRALVIAKALPLPNSPLDEMIDELGGPANVAEMTGRKARVVRWSRDATPQYESRDMNVIKSDMDSLNLKERNDFMKGRKLVAIISDAASTGISLHADARALNQRRRLHITIELPWSADKAVQQLGRSHRSNQTSGPLYKLVCTNLGGEGRFVASVARRLLSLGALTKGDRRAASGVDFSKFNFDSLYGRAALRTMYHAINRRVMVAGVSLRQITDADIDEQAFIQQMLECLVMMGVTEESTVTHGLPLREEKMGDVSRFLNRILGLPVQRQNLIFNYFNVCLETAVANAKKEGRYNEGMLDVSATSITMAEPPREIFKEAAYGDGITKLMTLSVDRGMTWESALEWLNSHPGTKCSFYTSRREVWGRKLFLLATEKQGSSHTFRVARPNTGLSVFDEAEAELLQKYAPIAASEAEHAWREQYQISETQCLHGRKCKTPDCTMGIRVYKMFLLMGGTVNIMSTLETVIARYGAGLHLPQAERNLRVVRVQLDDGRRVVGVRFPAVLLTQAMAAIKDALTPSPSVVDPEILSKLPPQLQASFVKPEKKPSDAVVEPVAEVVAKNARKALTAPPTLKNFFNSVREKAVPQFSPDVTPSVVNRENCTVQSEACRHTSDGKETELERSETKIDGENNWTSDNPITSLGATVSPLKTVKTSVLGASLETRPNSGNDGESVVNGVKITNHVENLTAVKSSGSELDKTLSYFKKTKTSRCKGVWKLHEQMLLQSGLASRQSQGAKTPAVVDDNCNVCIVIDSNDDELDDIGKSELVHKSGKKTSSKSKKRKSNEHKLDKTEPSQVKNDVDCNDNETCRRKSKVTRRGKKRKSCSVKSSDDGDCDYCPDDSGAPSTGKSPNGNQSKSKKKSRKRRSKTDKKVSKEPQLSEAEDDGIMTFGDLLDTDCVITEESFQEMLSRPDLMEKKVKV